MREAIETLLDAAGVEHATFGSAEALLAADDLQASACIVSDLKLPAMSGLALLATLRGRCSMPPLILITAHDFPAVRDEAMRLGAAAYLAKPFAGNALLAAIHGVTKR